MPIKTTGSSLVTGLFIAVTSCYVSAAPSNAIPSPYKLNITPGQSAQSDNQKADSADGASNTAAYQLENHYRSQDTSKSAPKVDAVATNKPSAIKNFTIPGKFSPESLNNEKLAHQPFAKEIALAASAASLDPALVHAVIYVESHYQHAAISPKGAIGLMQLLPQTAARYGIADPGKSSKANLKAGTYYLRDLMRMFDNRIDLALAAYNAGENAVLKNSMRIPPYPETRLYVIAVMAKYEQWRNNTASINEENDKGKDLQAPAPLKPAKPQYLVGTRLAVSDEQFAPNY